VKVHHEAFVAARDEEAGDFAVIVGVDVDDLAHERITLFFVFRV